MNKLIVALVAIASLGAVAPSPVDANDVGAEFRHQCEDIHGGKIAKFNRDDNYVVSGVGANRVKEYSVVSTLTDPENGLWLQRADVLVKAGYRIPIYRQWIAYPGDGFSSPQDYIENGSIPPSRSVAVLSVAPVPESIKLLWICAVEV